jgi:dihydroorotate dehydrogenase
MNKIPFYDPKLSYENNYDKGPFGAFADGKVYEQKGEPGYDFLGNKIYLPFGIPAGPLLNGKFVRAAFEKGFDICVYKTVRSDVYPTHPFPNILAIHPKEQLTLEKLNDNFVGDTNYEDPITITNSFGVPSRKPEIWQEDAKGAIEYAGPGQVMILSFMGTVRQGQTQQEFIDDFILAAKLAKETGAKVLETNLSCPNIGNEGLVCYNLEVTEKVVKGIRRVIGNTPFVIKVGYYKDDKQLKGLAEIANEYANDIAAINTLQVKVVNEKGEQALPGPNRMLSGICGSAIKWAGIETTKKLADIKDSENYKFKITGVGGVVEPQDYFDYKKAGADAVMSATGAMWNPYLAQEIKEAI